MLRFLTAGTLLGGLILSVLNWLTAAILPPRYKQFREPQAVVETIRATSAGDDIYTAPQGVFVAVALRPELSGRFRSVGVRLAAQVAIEFAVALGLSLLLLASRIRSPMHAAALLALAGLIAGVDTLPELELGRLSDEPSTGRDGVPRRQLVDDRTGAGGDPARAGGDGSGKVEKCALSIPRVSIVVQKTREVHDGIPAADL